MWQDLSKNCEDVNKLLTTRNRELKNLWKNGVVKILENAREEVGSLETTGVSNLMLRCTDRHWRLTKDIVYFDSTGPNREIFDLFSGQKGEFCQVRFTGSNEADIQLAEFLNIPVLEKETIFEIMEHSEASEEISSAFDLTYLKNLNLMYNGNEFQWNRVLVYSQIKIHFRIREADYVVARTHLVDTKSRTLYIFTGEGKDDDIAEAAFQISALLKPMMVDVKQLQEFDMNRIRGKVRPMCKIENLTREIRDYASVAPAISAPSLPPGPPPASKDIKTPRKEENLCLPKPPPPKKKAQPKKIPPKPPALMLTTPPPPKKKKHLISDKPEEIDALVKELDTSPENETKDVFKTKQSRQTKASQTGDEPEESFDWLDANPQKKRKRQAEITTPPPKKRRRRKELPAPQVIPELPAKSVKTEPANTKIFDDVTHKKDEGTALDNFHTQEEELFQVTGVTDNVEHEYVGKPPPPKAPEAPHTQPVEREDSEKEGEEQEEQEQIVYENAREPKIPPEPADPDEYAPSLPDPNMGASDDDYEEEHKIGHGEDAPANEISQQFLDNGAFDALSALQDPADLIDKHTAIDNLVTPEHMQAEFDGDIPQVPKHEQKPFIPNDDYDPNEDDQDQYEDDQQEEGGKYGNNQATGEHDDEDEIRSITDTEYATLLTRCKVTEYKAILEDNNIEYPQGAKKKELQQIVFDKVNDRYVTYKSVKRVLKESKKREKRKRRSSGKRKKKKRKKDAAQIPQEPTPEELFREKLANECQDWQAIFREYVDQDWGGDKMIEEAWKVQAKFASEIHDEFRASRRKQ